MRGRVLDPQRGGLVAGALFGATMLACHPTISLADATLARTKFVALLGFDASASSLDARRCALEWSTGTLDEASFPVDAPADLNLYVVSTSVRLGALRVARDDDVRVNILEGAALTGSSVELGPAAPLGLPPLSEGSLEAVKDCAEEP